jgi:hypothetical protein
MAHKHDYSVYLFFNSQLAARWRTLSSAEKQKYLDLEAEDRERFERESAEADALRLEEQEAG